MCLIACIFAALSDAATYALNSTARTITAVMAIDTHHGVPA